MHDILCIYYSRSGNTRAAAEEIAAALDAELAEITDAQDRSGLKGYFRSGLDAMRRTVQPIDPLQTERPLTDYRLVILASPVWAGRCASPVRALLKERGGELPRVRAMSSRAPGAANTRRFTIRWTAISPRSTNWPSPCGQGARAMTSGWAISYRTSSACLRSDDDAGKAAEN